MNKISPQDKLNGLKELVIYRRYLKRLKWYQIYQKRAIRKQISIVKLMYEI